MTTYTLKEMIQLWCRNLGLLVDDCGCAVTRHDGSSLDALVADRIRAWYADLLLTADPLLVPQRDLADEVADAKAVSANCMEMTLPDAGARPLLVQLADWDEPLGCFHTPQSPEALRQRCKRLAATPRHPVAVRAGRLLRLYGLAADAGETDGRVIRLVMTAPPADADAFTLHESLLLTIPNSL